MKQAVNTFIEAVADKYNAEKSDHRIAVVTFGTNASTLMDWTLVTPAETDTAESPSGETALKAKINGLPSEPEGATNVADGMQVRRRSCRATAATPVPTRNARRS